MACLMSPFLRVAVALSHPSFLDSWNGRSNMLLRIQNQQRWLSLFPCACLGTIQWNNHRETMQESNVNTPSLHTNSPAIAEPVIESYSGEPLNILKSGKIRSLFQWSSRVTRTPQPPRPPASGKGSSGKGKPEDDPHAAGGTASRRNTSPSSSDSSCSSRRSHSSVHSRHDDDHDHGVDWDW